MSGNRVASSLAFKFAERIAAKGLGLIISIVLAHLIAPEIHGLLAIVMVFVNLAQTFVDSGMATALVQNRDTAEDDYSTVFYVSLAIAAVMNVLLYFAAPLIAQLYESEMLISPLRVLALSLFFGAFNAIQTAKLQREMRFGTMMLCSLTGTVVSGVVGVTAALCGAGLWALVIYHMTNVIAVTVSMLAAEKWRPRLVFSGRRARELFGFGWKMLVSSLLTSLYGEIRTLVVGYRYTKTDLAYYNRGFQFPHVISSTLDVSIQSVMLPVMARAQEDRERLRRMLLQTLSASMFVVVPVMLGLAAVAQTLIPLLLGSQWVACIPMLCVFCFSDLVLPVKTTSLSLLKAIGRSDVYMKTELIRRIIMLIVLLVTVLCFDSVMAIAVGYALNSWLDAWIITRAVKGQIGVGWLRQMQAVWKTLLAGAAMFALVWLMNALALPVLFKLALQILTGAAAYLLFSLALRNDALRFLLGQLRGLLRRGGGKTDAKV